MGCCASRSQLDVITRRTVHELGLSKFEIGKLVKLFKKVDSKGNGVIQSNEFFDFFDLQPSLVNKLLFSCYDIEGNGEMNLAEFICTLWSFFTVKPEHIGEFVYFIFDLKKSGQLPFAEVTRIVKQIHKKHYEESSDLQGLVNKMVKGPEGSSRKKQNMAPGVFRAWCEVNPDVCRPVVGKQIDMMAKCFKKGFWKTIAIKKSKADRLNDTYYMYNFINKIHGNRDAFKKKLSAEEQASQAQKNAILAKISAEAADKAEKVSQYKKNAKPSLATSESFEASYFNVEDIDNLMDNYILTMEDIKNVKKKNDGGKTKKNIKKNLPPVIDNSTKKKELPPLVLNALRKGQLSSAPIAPMDNCRISDAARAIVQKERAKENSSDDVSQLTPEEKKRIFAHKAARSNKAMGSAKDILH